VGGLDRPTSGSVLVDGQDLAGMDDERLADYRHHQVGFVFQSFNLIPTMTARGNVELPLVFAGVAPAERSQRSQAALEAVGLGLRMHHRPTELSGQAIYMSATGVFLQHPGLGGLVAPASPLDPPGLPYALLSQIDIWIVWGLVILFGALLSTTMGIGRKRAVTGLVTFVAITGILQAIPTLIAGAFLGSM